MNTQSILESGCATSDEALDLFDSLEAVDTDFMTGQWKGKGLYTNHPMDGLLEAFQWHGKRFDSTEDVHPLIFPNPLGRLVSVNPRFVAPLLRLPVPKSFLLGRIARLFIPLLSTSRSKARLRMTTYRGKSSATMIYDQIPVNDVFRKIDQNTVLGLMDMKGMSRPFFFILRRE